jgi:hypothetical protein
MPYRSYDFQDETVTNLFRTSSITASLAAIALWLGFTGTGQSRLYINLFKAVAPLVHLLPSPNSSSHEFCRFFLRQSTSFMADPHEPSRPSVVDYIASRKSFLSTSLIYRANCWLSADFQGLKTLTDFISNTTVSVYV